MRPPRSTRRSVPIFSRSLPIWKRAAAQDRDSRRGPEGRRLWRTSPSGWSQVGWVRRAGNEDSMPLIADVLRKPVWVGLPAVHPRQPTREDISIFVDKCLFLTEPLNLGPRSKPDPALAVEVQIASASRVIVPIQVHWGGCKHGDPLFIKAENANVINQDMAPSGLPGWPVSGPACSRLRRAAFLNLLSFVPCPHLLHQPSPGSFSSETTRGGPTDQRTALQTRLRGVRRN